MVTRTTTPLKRTAASTTTTAKKSVTKAPARKSVAAKAPVQRKPRALAAKPVASIVEKSLKPVVAKSVATTAKRPVVAVKAKVQPVAAKTLTKTKAKKSKLVRDSFSFPEHEHELLSALKQRAKKLGREFKKSEILRAGVAHLVAMADAALMAALDKVERVKTGRPAKKGKKK